MLQVAKVIFYSCEGWKGAGAVGQCLLHSHYFHWQLRNVLHFKRVQPSFVSSVYCVGLLSAPSVRIMKTIFTSLFHNLLMQIKS